MNNEIEVKDLSIIDEVVAASIDIELMKLIMEDQRTLVGQRLLSLYYKSGHYAIFVSSVTNEIMEDIFTDIVYRDFMLNLTDRICFELKIRGTSMSDYIEVLSETYTPVLDGEHSIVPVGVAQTLNTTSDKIKSILESNPWLITVILIVKYFHITEYYKEII